MYFLRWNSIITLLVSATTLLAGDLAAKTWFVQGGADGDPCAANRGSKHNPFATLGEVEDNTRPHDIIRVLGSAIPLDAGADGGPDGLFILQEGQALIGPGRANCADAFDLRCKERRFTAVITNSIPGDIGDFHKGAGVILSGNNRVRGIHFDQTEGAAIFALNADRIRISNVLMTATNQMGASNGAFDGFSGSPGREGYPAIAGIVLNYDEAGDYRLRVRDVVARPNYQVAPTLNSRGGMINIYANGADVEIDASLKRMLVNGQLSDVRANPLGFAQQSPSYFFMAENAAVVDADLRELASFEPLNNDGIGVHPVNGGQVKVDIDRYRFVGSSKVDSTPGIVETGLELIDELGLFAENFLRLSFGFAGGVPIPIPTYPASFVPAQVRMQNSTLEKGESGVILLVHPQAIVDLGGGPLGSEGNNRIVDNNLVGFPNFNLGIGGSAYPPAGPPEDLLENLIPMIVYASNNYWGTADNVTYELDSDDQNSNGDTNELKLARFDALTGNKQQDNCVLTDVDPSDTVVPDFATFSCVLSEEGVTIITAPVLESDPLLDQDHDDDDDDDD